MGLSPANANAARMQRLFGIQDQDELASFFSSFLNHNKNTLGAVASVASLVPGYGTAIAAGIGMLLPGQTQQQSPAPAPPPPPPAAAASSGSSLVLVGAAALVLVVMLSGRGR